MTNPISYLLTMIMLNRVVVKNIFPYKDEESQIEVSSTMLILVFGRTRDKYEKMIIGIRGELIVNK